MQLSSLVSTIRSKKSCLCVGLDLDLQKLPVGIGTSPGDLLFFIKEIIDATRPYAVAYKPNTAFFESLGSKGWDLLGQISDYIGDGHLRIADAKRGDIGNTAKAYANAFFNQLNYDAVTLSPYMGLDTIQPFLEYKNKWSIVLGLTSNPGFEDFQMAKLDDGRYLFEKVVTDLTKDIPSDRLMLVVGATRSSFISKIRTLAPHHFFLMPGIGAQGGSLQESMTLGSNDQTGLLINASRSILYASSSSDFAISAAHQAALLQAEMEPFILT
jgi:orotidine-5'-phosphate decarboxylase